VVVSYILMVDDDWFLGDIVVGALERRGWPVRVAGSGSAALDVVSSAPPALVLLDVGIPEGDGWFLLRRLRQALSEEVPVVVVSAQPVTRTQIRLYGIHGYIAKPFSMSRLLEYIEAIGLAPGAGEEEGHANGTSQPDQGGQPRPTGGDR
jgi:DNA-binding response OmpR family regulator